MRHPYVIPFAAIGNGEALGPMEGNTATLQATVSGTGAVTAAAALDGTNTPENANSWVQLTTASPSGTTNATAAATVSTAFLYFRIRLTGLTGTGAAAVCSLAKAG